MDRKQATDSEPATKRTAGFGQTARAVLWSFFGVRRKADYQKDAVQLNPLHVIIVGIAVAALFVFILIMIVRAVVG